jgi:hypothetical protein
VDNSVVDECPGWFLQYEQFHLTNRAQPRAKYLIHKVPATAAASGGLGSRLNAMIFTLRAAAAMKRVVLFTWEFPYGLTNFFVPAATIDWTLHGLNVPLETKHYDFVDKDMPAVRDGSILQDSDVPFITFFTNAGADAACYGCPQLDLWTRETACIWKRLFRPADDIVLRAEKQLQSLFKQSKLPVYDALHLRLGGLTGELELDAVERAGGRNPLQQFANAVECVRKLQQNITGSLGAPLASNGAADDHPMSSNVSDPVMIVTDNHEFRRLVQGGALGPAFVAPQGLPIHTDRAVGQQLVTHQNTVVDLVLLGWARCLVVSPTALSYHAWLYGGGKECRRPFMHCTL